MSIPVYFVDHGTPRLHISEPTTASNLSRARQCYLEYLNEGGANVVFSIHPLIHEELPPRLKRKLLRLGKNLSHVQTAEDQLKALDTNFATLFPAEHLIQHELIALDAGVLSQLNGHLESLIRPSHRIEDFLAPEEKFGLLVTDMTPDCGEVLLQLKPKWLSQSPNAPPSAKRCRTCAVRAQRASERIRTATDAQESCPLDLVNPNLEQRKLAVYAITPDRKLREFLLDTAQPLLQQLRASQVRFDPSGALKISGPDSIQMLCKAMTLRDCTLFMKRSGNVVEARLGDLDLKQPERLMRWKKVELTLVQNGWYTNTEPDVHWMREKICLLSR